jgi:hypothetical protein
LAEVNRGSWLLLTATNRPVKGQLTPTHQIPPPNERQTIISKALGDVGIKSLPSRRCFSIMSESGPFLVAPVGWSIRGLAAFAGSNQQQACGMNHP